MSERMTVHQNGQAIYDIVLEHSFDSLGKELKQLNTQKRKLCIVVDSNVAPIYLEEVRSIMISHSAQTDEFVFPAGEEYKTLDTVRKLYQYLIEKRYDRNDMLIALGGGVTGDLCGYAAATYLRGISFVQIPTSLLSQVDSGIGGKTGVDFDSYKNMVGAFHMPSLVYTNAAALLTLPDEQFASGMGEVLKHGLIKSRSYYDWIWDNRDAIIRRDLDVCLEMVRASDEIKREIVERDPHEQGERGLLNFGHTLGHAIEKMMDFRLLHGHCVALGCVAAAYLSMEQAWITNSDYEEIKRRFEYFGLPVTFSGANNPEIIRATKNDKKMEAGRIKFILIREIGQAYVDTDVTDARMELALSALMDGWRTK